MRQIILLRSEAEVFSRIFQTVLKDFQSSISIRELLQLSLNSYIDKLKTLLRFEVPCKLLCILNDISWFPSLFIFTKASKRQVILKLCYASCLTKAAEKKNKPVELTKDLPNTWHT